MCSLTFVIYWVGWALSPTTRLAVSLKRTQYRHLRNGALRQNDYFSPKLEEKEEKKGEENERRRKSNLQTRKREIVKRKKRRSTNKWPVYWQNFRTANAVLCNGPSDLFVRVQSRDRSCLFSRRLNGWLALFLPLGGKGRPAVATASWQTA